MSEPVSGTVVAASGAVMATTGAYLMPGVDAGTFYCAFAGAVLFVVSSTEIAIFKRIAYMAAAMIIGAIVGPGISDLIELPIRWAESHVPGVTPTQLHPGVGAAVTSATVVYILLALIDKAKSTDETLSNMSRFLRLLRRVKK